MGYEPVRGFVVVKGKIMASNRNDGGMSDKEMRAFEEIVSMNSELERSDVGVKGAFKKPMVRAIAFFAGAFIVLVLGIVLGLPIFSQGNLIGAAITLAGFALAIVLGVKGYARLDAARHPERLFEHTGATRSHRS